MPVTSDVVAEHRDVVAEHRERLKSLYWDKLGHATTQQLALVARLVSQAEVDRTPDAEAAMDKEWQKLTDTGCWLEDKVRGFPGVQREAQHQQRKMHIGRIFEICSQKGSELPKEHPDQKWSQAPLSSKSMLGKLTLRLSSLTLKLGCGCRPRNRWPKEWKGMKDPVCPLRLASYGHPD